MVAYLSCHIVETMMNDKIVMVQFHLVNFLIENFEPKVREMLKGMTPGTQRLKIHRPSEEMEVPGFEFQKMYCSGVGMMLYLTKYS